MVKMTDVEFDARSFDFLRWFQSYPGTTFHPDIGLVDLRIRNAGRGIVATADIPAETALFTIPRTAILNSQTSDLAKRAPGIFDSDDLDPSDPWIALILVMIYEYLQGDASPWSAYLRILPESFDTPMFWSKTELKELQTSSLKNKIGKSDADRMITTKVVPQLDKYSNVFYPPGVSRLSKKDALALGHRMGSTIMAYSFDLDPDDSDEEPADADDEWVEDRSGNMLGMVPMADILNADAEFNAHVSHEDDALVVRSLRPIGKGEEVLNYYGPHPNSELLRRYGYVTERHSRYDVVEIPWSNVSGRIQKYLKLTDEFWQTALKNVDQDDLDDALLLERETGEPSAKGTFESPARIGIPPEVEDQFKKMLKAVKKVSASVVPDKRKRDDTTRTVMLEAIRDHLARYPTTLEDDLTMLNTEGLEARRRMALIVRSGEKKLLREFIEYLSTAREGEEDDSQSTKKIRAN